MEAAKESIAFENLGLSTTWNDHDLNINDYKTHISFWH